MSVVNLQWSLIVNILTSQWLFSCGFNRKIVQMNNIPLIQALVFSLCLLSCIKFYFKHLLLFMSSILSFLKMLFSIFPVHFWASVEKWRLRSKLYITILQPSLLPEAAKAQFLGGIPPPPPVCLKNGGRKSKYRRRKEWRLYLVLIYDEIDSNALLMLYNFENLRGEAPNPSWIHLHLRPTRSKWLNPLT